MYEQLPQPESRKSTDTPEKYPYTPSTRRFEISKDSITQKRKEILQQGYEKLKAFFPVSVAITSFGSFTKGKNLSQETAASTDVDCVFFIDESLVTYVAWLQVHIPDIASVLSSEVFNRNPNILWRSARFKNSLHSKIREVIFKDVPFEDVFVTDDFDGSVLPISHSSLLTEVKRLCNTYYESQYEEDEQYASFGRNFGLDIGGGAKPYRQSFFQQLLEMKRIDKNQADTLWYTARIAILFSEQQKLSSNQRVEDTKRFSIPEKLEDAALWYGVSLN